jgi:urease accessory protein
MFCDRFANPADRSAGLTDETIELEWWELQRRAIRKIASTGRTVRVVLPLGAWLADGAALTDADGLAIVRVVLRPCEVIVIHPRNPMELATVALELGNFHAPTEFADGVIRTVPDGPVEELMATMDLPHERQIVKFNPRRCVGMPEIRVSSDFRVITR